MSLDFPRAWQIAREFQAEKHHPKCSFAQTNGGILCDCDVIYEHAEYKDKANLYTTSGKIYKRK